MPAEPPLSFAQLQAQARERNLVIHCALDEAACDDFEQIAPGTRSLLLLSPDEPGFWQDFEDSPESEDGDDDPFDRYTVRIVGDWADALEVQDYYPALSARTAPFLGWALASQTAHASPVGMLVHPHTGLWLSFRAALALDWPVDVPAPEPIPCRDCDAPCATACPVGAMTHEGYDAEACRAHLSSPAGAPCLSHGCMVRHACPIGQGFPRLDRQSEYHMRVFRGY